MDPELALALSDLGNILLFGVGCVLSLHLWQLRF